MRRTPPLMFAATLGVAALGLAPVVSAAVPATAAPPQASRCEPLTGASSTPAQRATVSASQTSSWNDIASVQDGRSVFTGGTNAEVWGTWSPSRPAKQWLQYDWDGDATLTGATLSFWHNNASDTAGNDVAVPTSWKLQSWNGTGWVDVALAAGSAYGRDKGAANEVTFAGPVVTSRLRAVMNATTDGVSYAAVAVSDFAVAGDAPERSGAGAETLSSDHFAVSISRATGGIYGLTNTSDGPVCTNYVANPQIHPSFDVDDSRWVGDVVMRANGAVRTTSLSDDIRTVSRDGDGVKVAYTGDAANTAGLRGVDLTEQYTLTGTGGDTLDWSLSLKNTSSTALQLDDLSIPMLMNSWWNGGDQTGIYEQNVGRHSFVADDGSYAYWQRPNGEGPYLVMVPKDGTSLEFRDKARTGEGIFGEKDPSWEGLVSFAIHSKGMQPERAGKIGGYLPATSATVAAGDTATYGFTFRWADDYTDLHDVLYESGVVDAISLPGMVIPQDTKATLAVRAKETITGVVGEDGKNVGIVRKGTRNGYDLYELTFPTAGPNRVDVLYGKDKRSVLQYNSIEPIGQLVEKRADFLVDNQQARNTGRGYEGAFLQWDMSRTQKVTWQNFNDSFKSWMAGGSDDLGLSPAVFLSEQNLIEPNQSQISALDYYIDKFIWGYMQTQTDANGNRTYRVYHWYDGTDGNRPGTPDGLATWRVMNYPHVWNTYLNMYRIAKTYPTVKTELTADEYLMRAYNTMKAYFEHPNVGTLDDASRHMGSMGEMTMPDVVDALSSQGHQAEADKLEGYIHAKADEMLSRDYPFASEMSIDTTAFEATYTLAKRYGDDSMARKVTQASLASRGLQPLWYYYGSDNRHMGESWWNLGYETQLGAWQQQDYLKNYDATAQGIDPDEAMRSTYGAYLAGWSNINTGQISADPANIGAASWQYQSQLGAGEGQWGFMPQLNGWWAFSGEADLGFWGGLKTASVNIVDDKVVGAYAYGGELSDSDGALSIVPQDGVRQRATFYDLNKFSFALTGGQYSSARVAKDLSSVDVVVENALAGSSRPQLTMTRLPAGTYDVSIDGTKTTSATAPDGRLVLTLPALASGSHDIRIEAATPTTGATPTPGATSTSGVESTPSATPASGSDPGMGAGATIATKTARPSSLAATGMNAALPFVAIASLIAVTGVLLSRVRRRRAR